MSNEWKEKIAIEGLIARDSTDWKEELIVGMQQSGYGVIWKDCLPTLSHKVMPLLVQLLEDKGLLIFILFQKIKLNIKQRL